MLIRRAESDAEIAACFGVVRELRPSLVEATFVADVRRMEAQGFRLACALDPDVRAVAGYRVMEMFATGRVLYVDDLVTAAAHRSRGYGKALLAWLDEQATRQGCRYLELDSASSRADAHRFYRREGLEEVALHFSKPIGGASVWRPGA